MVLKIELPKLTPEGVLLDSLNLTDVFDYQGDVHMLLDWDDGTYLRVLNLTSKQVTTLRNNVRVRVLNATLTVTDPNAVPQLNAAELAFVRNGNRITAIKEVRSRLGWGLKEAKEFVDAEAIRLGIKL